jgi:hypothetical protein
MIDSAVDRHVGPDPDPDPDPERERHRVSEDELDARLIREARRSDRSKVRYSVNELREQRGLAAI